MKRSLLIVSLLLSGCMVGPRYRPPIETLPVVFSEDRERQDEVGVDEDLAQWWKSFNDPFLDELLAESLQGGFDLLIALERVCQARAEFLITVAGIFPELDSNATATRSRTSQTLTTTSQLNLPPIQSFYQAGLDVIWQIDIFGGLRRAARAAYYNWEATAEEARAVRIMLLSDVAATYTTICSLQQQTDIALQTVELDEELVALAQVRFEAGLADEPEVQLAIALFEEDQATLKNLETATRQAIYSLSILLGRPPESLLEPFSIARPIPVAEGRVPVGMPSDLLRRRPDIRSAERQIAAATEQIGVAVASLFPQLSLTGSSSSFSSNPLQGANAGFASNALNKLFTSPSRIWGIGGLVTFPLFDFGRRLAVIKEQVAIEHQALFTYEKTVIGALQEVESTLVAYFNEEEAQQSLNQAQEAYQRTLDLSEDKYQAGLASYTQYLQDKSAWLNSLNNVIISQRALTIDLITLYKALGGGWECSYMP